jgi:drug/metabolite transporter (DMT)-like permease
MPLSDNARGALFMTLSMGGFAVNDAIMKVTFETMPLAQGIFLRGFCAGAIILGIAWHAGAFRFRPSARDVGILAVRTTAELVGTLTFMIAIANMPIAAATAILQAAPLAVTMTAALFLREPVGWRRWSAIAVGFAGVLIMVRPGGADFDVYAALAIGTVVCVTIRDVATRYLSHHIPSSFVASVTVVSVSLGGAAVSLLEGWQPVSGPTLGLYAGAGAFIVVGYLFSVTAMRVGEVSAVSPFRYTVLLYALILGFVIFGEVPDAPTAVGAAIVMGAGLYTLWREQRKGRTRSAAEAPAHPFDASDANRFLVDDSLLEPAAQQRAAAITPSSPACRPR